MDKEQTVIELAKPVDVNDADFINDDNFGAFKLLGLKSKMHDINTIVGDITAKQNELVSGDDDTNFIDERLESLTEADINNMTGAQIDELLTDPDGNIVEFEVDFGNDTKRMYQFKKDYLVMRKQSQESLKTFDAEIAKINAEIAECQDEFDRLVDTYGNVSNLIRSTLQTRLDSAQSDEQKNLFKTMLDAFDNAKSLDNVKQYCSSYRGRQIIWDIKNDKRSDYIYRRYKKVIDSLGIKTDLTKFNFLEKRFLTEEYQGRDNIFVFAVIHFISSWHGKQYTKADGLFLTQFTIMLKNLFYNKFEDEHDREIFISNIQDVIKIIG